MEIPISPEIIEAASKSNLGTLSLMVLIVGILALVFFRNAPTSVKVFIFMSVLTSVAGYGYALVGASKHTAPPAIDNEEVIPTPDEPRTTSQIFKRSIGNNSSCTESNVQRTFELCLAEEFDVKDWSVSTRSQRNGSSEVTRTDRQNCVNLKLRYSDSGKGFLGDCKGNGWVNVHVTVNGKTK